mgnify:CR=1 FL=1
MAINLDDIRRSSSKVYVMGESFNERRKQHLGGVFGGRVGTDGPEDSLVLSDLDDLVSKDGDDLDDGPMNETKMEAATITYGNTFVP